MQKREFSGPVATLTATNDVLVSPLSPEEVEQLLRGIQKAYILPHSNDVVRFLREHPSLIEIVQKAAVALRQIFGFEAPLTLELFHDPDTEDTELFALVHSDEPVDAALAKLQMFDETWFLDQQPLIDGLFNVDVVFS
ncbi:MAG: hypothetical protein GXP42_17460 [Chloroflexi bacterium]|nr:hypothetical protein [Chloroflexota bacterium]